MSSPYDFSVLYSGNFSASVHRTSNPPSGSSYAMSDGNIDPRLLDISSSHIAPTVSQHIDPQVHLSPLPPFYYHASSPPAFHERGSWYQHPLSSNVVDWRAYGPRNFGEDPFPLEQIAYKHRDGHHRPTVSRTIHPSALHLGMGLSTMVPTRQEFSSPSKKTAWMDRTEDHMLASIPVRRSARLRGKGPYQLPMKRMREDSPSSTSSFELPDAPLKRSAEQPVAKKDMKMWQCFFQHCTDSCTDERGRSRHMDSHFPPRFCCAKKRCRFETTRLDQARIHAGKCSGSKSRFITLDPVPHWQKKENMQYLRRPDPTDPMWFIPIKLEPGCLEWFRDLPLSCDEK